jgi:GT2 family glycosyltransferase/tetratricopeptide (TPR) repeat protein
LVSPEGTAEHLDNPHPFHVSLIILAHNQLADTRQCLASIEQHTPISHELILVDNASTDGTTDFFRKFASTRKNVRIIVNKNNLGFAGGNNQGLALARGEHVLLLNNDTVVTQGWLERLLTVFQRFPEVGLVGPVSNCVSGPQLISPVRYKRLADLPSFAVEVATANAGQTAEVPRLVGFCLLMRRAVVEKLGGLDERFGSGNFEDDDLCLRAGFAGFKLRIAGDSFVHHTGSQTFKGAKIDFSASMLRNWELFKAKWGMPKEAVIENGYRVPQDPLASALAHIPLPDINSSHQCSPEGNVWTETAQNGHAIQQTGADLSRNDSVALGSAVVPTAVFGVPPKTFAVSDATKGSEESGREGVSSSLSRPVIRSTDPIKLPECALVGHLIPPRELLTKKNLRAAWESTISAINSRPFHPEAYLLLAEIALVAGDSVSARRCAQFASDMAPEFKPAKKFLKGNLRGNLRPEWLQLPLVISNRESKPSPGRNDSVALGSATVPVAVFGVSPKTLSASESAPFGVGETVMELAGGTPAKGRDGTIREMPTLRAGTGALPTASFRLRLTVCLIAKNEERFLAQCLSSVKGLATQTIVIDTGSTDRTVEIAREHGAEVHTFAWADDFSAARNEALKHATGDWILNLDADEELLPEHRETILREIQAASVMAYRLPIIDKGREHEGCSYVPRLFRNAPGLFFVGRVHEQIFSSIEVRRGQWGLENRLGTATLLHHGYTSEIVVSREKIARNLRLLELAIQELPGEPNLLMNLGLELVRSGKLEDGLQRYGEALNLLAALPSAQVVPELREALLTQYTTHLIKAGRFTEVLEIWQTPFAKSADMTASQHFLLGLAFMELKQPAEAAAQMRDCLEKRGHHSLTPAHGEVRKAAPNHCLALALAALKQTAEAEKSFHAALAEESESRPLRFDFARFLADANKPLEALTVLNQLVAEQPAEARVWQLGGHIALSRPDFAEFGRDWTGEAIKHCPHDTAIALQRAESLMLNQEVEQALPLWQKAHSSTSARHLAALVLCECVAASCNRVFAPSDEPVVSAEFQKWYQQLIKANANSLVYQLNESMETVARVLPTFGAAWQRAMSAVQKPQSELTASV